MQYSFIAPFIARVRLPHFEGHMLSFESSCRAGSLVVGRQYNKLGVSFSTYLELENLGFLCGGATSFPIL
jgi:hypothetical protein